jgi:hypothetical protein
MRTLGVVGELSITGMEATILNPSSWLLQCANLWVLWGNTDTVNHITTNLVSR